MSTWYYAGAEREQLGPVSTDELKQHYNAARITLDTLVWRDGMIQWRPLGELAQQLGLVDTLDTGAGAAIAVRPANLPPPPPVHEEPEAPPVFRTVTPEPVAVTGRAVFSLGTDPGLAPAPVRPSSETLARAAAQNDQIAAAANPYASGVAPLHAHVAASDQDVVYAGFWKRAAGSIIDSFILSLGGGLAGEVLGVVLADLTGGGKLSAAILTLFATLAVCAVYYAWFQSTLNYATPGKMAVGIKVVRSNGEPISFLRGIGRFFATMLSSLILMIGYLMAALTSRKQALHDVICDTVVVDKWAFTATPEQQRSELGMVATIVLVLYGLLLVLLMIGFFLLGMAGAMLR